MKKKGNKKMHTPRQKVIHNPIHSSPDYPQINYPWSRSRSHAWYTGRMAECVSQKERKKERKEEKSALPAGFEPTPLAIRGVLWESSMVGSGK